MKVAILCSDVPILDDVIIYKVLAIDDAVLKTVLKYDISDPEDILSLEGIVNLDTYVGINGYLNIKAGTLIEFPEPINSFEINSGVALVYYDDIRVLPAGA